MLYRSINERRVGVYGISSAEKGRNEVMTCRLLQTSRSGGKKEANVKYPLTVIKRIERLKFTKRYNNSEATKALVCMSVCHSALSVFFFVFFPTSHSVQQEGNKFNRGLREIEVRGAIHGSDVGNFVCGYLFPRYCMFILVSIFLLFKSDECLLYSSCLLVSLFLSLSLP